MSAPLTTESANAAPRSRLRGYVERFRALFHELGKFGVVGALTFVVDLGLFNLLLSSMTWLPAKVISTIVAASMAFVGNRFWTWRDRERSGLHREYGLYFFFNAVGLAISLACGWLSHDVLGAFWPAVFHTRLADNIATQFVGVILGTVFRFWSYRRYVFVKASPE